MALLDSTKSGIEQDVEELTHAVCSCVVGIAQVRTPLSLSANLVESHYQTQQLSGFIQLPHLVLFDLSGSLHISFLY